MRRIGGEVTTKNQLKFKRKVIDSLGPISFLVAKFTVNVISSVLLISYVFTEIEHRGFYKYNFNYVQVIS